MGEKIYGDVQQLYFFPFIYLTFAGSQLFSLLSIADKTLSPRALVQRSLSLQLPLQSCHPHASFLPTHHIASHCAKCCMGHPGPDHPTPDHPAYLLSRHMWKTGVCLGGGTYHQCVY